MNLTGRGRSRTFVMKVLAVATALVAIGWGVSLIVAAIDNRWGWAAYSLVMAIGFASFAYRFGRAAGEKASDVPPRPL